MNNYDPDGPEGPQSSTATLDVDPRSREELLRLADDMAFLEPLRLPRPRRVEADETPAPSDAAHPAVPANQTDSVDEAVREQLMQFAEEIEMETEE